VNADPATTLFDEVVEASGLVDLIAPFAVSRLLIAADVVSPRDLTHSELARALPTIETGLATYLRGEDLEQAIENLRRLSEREE
jgi:hypothetical protein